MTLTETLVLEKITQYDDPLPLAPNLEHLVTEDDTPVDNMFSAKQQRLLVEPLYSSWQSSHPFLADANVGIFYGVHQSPIVPDVFLSLEVQPPTDWWAKRGRAYFTWEFGKPPEVAIEIVSNTKGGELVEKLRKYAQIYIPYYVIFDPLKQLQSDKLVVYQWRDGRYLKQRKPWLERVQLGLTLWEGVYEDGQATWLRWCDSQGKLIPTGRERADHEQWRADHEQARADHEEARALTLEQQMTVEKARALTLEQELAAERQRMQALLAQLAAQGINPDQLK